MSEKNHIDDLFQSKLAGREVAYSASAWAGASQMLDKHYRWLAIKKWLMVLVPLILISGGGLFWMLQDGDADVADAPHAIEKIDPASVLPTPESNSTAVSVVEKQQANEVDETYDVATSSEYEETERTHSEIVRVEDKSAASAIDHIAARHTIQEEALPKVDIAVAAAAAEEKGFVWNSSTVVHTQSEIERTQKKSEFLGMPVFSVGKVSIDCYNDPAETGVDIPAPVLNELRKVQVVGEAAVIGAQGFLNQSAKRKALVPGAYLGVGMEYHQNQTLMYRLDASVMLRSGLAANDTIGFGSNVTTIQPLTATYLNLAASVGYKIGARHTIRGGMQFGTLAHVLVREKQGLPGDASAKTSFTNDKTGFSSLDFAPFIGYEMAVAPRWDVNAALFYGIPDMTESLGGRYPAEDPNRYIRLGVSYRLR